MERYGAIAAIAPFAAAVRAFDRLKDDLGGPRAAVLAHHEMEELIEMQGREVLRLLFQGHLDLRARVERDQQQHAGTAGLVGPDGLRRPYRETGHHRDRPACSAPSPLSGAPGDTRA